MRVVPFDQVAAPQSDKGKRLKQRDYLQEGSLAVIDQGQQNIGGFTDDQSMAFEGELPVVLFGDHTRSVKLVNHPFAVGADGIKIFRPAAGVRAKYLYYWMKSAPIPDRGYGRHYQFLRQLSVPLPSELEQDEIVAELEKQFSRLDEAVANLQRVKANLKRYKASVLKAAVEGRLVETEASLTHREGRTYETGEQLLRRILSERRAKWNGKGKYKEPLSHDLQVLPDAPAGWTWCALDVVAEETLLGLDRGRDQQRAENIGARYVKMNNVSMDGDVQTDELVYVDASEEEVARYELANGDLLFNTRNSLELVGKVGIVRSMPIGTVFNNNLMRIRTCGGVSSVFLGYQMCAPDFRQRMENVKKATTSIAAVYQKDLLPLHIALPPVGEQTRIVAEVDRHLSIIREVESEVDTNLKRAHPPPAGEPLCLTRISGPAPSASPPPRPARCSAARARVCWPYRAVSFSSRSTTPSAPPAQPPPWCWAAAPMGGWSGRRRTAAR